MPTNMPLFVVVQHPSQFPEALKSSPLEKSSEVDSFVWGLCAEHGTSCECFECGAPCCDCHEEWCRVGAQEEAEALEAFREKALDAERAECGCDERPTKF